MSADVCKMCHGSGWYEPKNMGGMMLEPCNRCDAQKTIQAAQKSSADVCPVCGKGRSAAHPGFTCGEESGFSDCENARDLAIERAAEIARLKAALKRIADQGPHYGPDRTTATWRHWRDIARETLEAKP